MDEQIQSILNQALSPQTEGNQAPQSDPVAEILQSAGVGEQTPSDVSNAESYKDQPIDKGYCETFAEQMAGLPNMGGSAAEAWNNWVKQGKAYGDVSQATPGSLVYFAPDASNGGAGHVGIVVDKQGNFISADYDKVNMNNLKTWKQKPMGYVPITH